MAGDWHAHLRRGVLALDPELSDAAQAQLAQYVTLLARWNKTYNLTAVRDEMAMVPRHILDSLVVRPYLHGVCVLDIGTGAGLPGIPLAITEPERTFTLLDSNGKKTRFCLQAASELELANIEVVRERVEDYRPAQGFDTVISRAFSDISAFVAVAQPLLAAGGRILAMKGAFPHAELASLPANVQVRAVHPLAVPGLDAERHLVELEVS